MHECPILAMPRPKRLKLTGSGHPIDDISMVDPSQQIVRVGQKFKHLENSLRDPQVLAELRQEPSAIVPERTLVFEVASKFVDFDRAVRGVEGLDFLKEDDGDAVPDEFFFCLDKQGQKVEDKRVPRRFYFTIPNKEALDELVRLWKQYQAGQQLRKGQSAWKKVFGCLVEMRPWGPKDRLTEDVVKDWKERLEMKPNETVRFEVEFWYRNSASRRQSTEMEFRSIIEKQSGRLLDSVTIDQIQYHAVLAEVVPTVINDVLAHPEVGLITFDGIMVLRPQSMVSGSVDASLEDVVATESQTISKKIGPPVAALLDGVPMVQHERLSSRLVIDDPDDFSNLYGAAQEHRHATAMASLILHGDLNVQIQSEPVRHQLYVRPVMYPQSDGFESRSELMPRNRLTIDLIWRAFIRMFDGEGGEAATAPNVCVINLSLGDTNRRFADVMSPWARLLDYLTWNYRVLILVSAGNILDPIQLDDVESWVDFEKANEGERQATLLRAILQKRADRRLLSPSEAINVLTVGAAHMDDMSPNTHSVSAIDPYQSSFLPNPSSALGLGFKQSIKPEILLPGGAEQVDSRRSHEPIEVSSVMRPKRYFGIGVASPDNLGQTDRQINMSGTSVATALATHGALRILEALNELPDDPIYPKVESDYFAVILKALLVHGARWDQTTVDMLNLVINESGINNWLHVKNEVSRFLGFGRTDIDRVVGCAVDRATLIAWNTIHTKELDQYQIPLPIELEGMPGFRAFTVTIAWLTPIKPSHCNYRCVRFEAAPAGQNKEFSLGISNAKHQPYHHAVGKGTIYHRRWEGTNATDFIDNGYLFFDVKCLPTAGLTTSHT